MAKKENGALAKRVEADLPAKLTPADIKKYICPKADDAEIFMFINHCVANQLDPYRRDAYLIKYDSNKPASMVTNYRIFLERSAEFPDYNGMQSGVIVTKGHEVIEREGAIVLTGETLFGGWCKVYRKGREHPTVVKVMMSEYLQTKWKDGKRVPQAKWKTSPATMIRKTAVGQGHHDAYPGPFSEMYTDAELPTGGADLPETPIHRNGETVVETAEVSEGQYEEAEPENVVPKCETCDTELTVENVVYCEEQDMEAMTCFKCLGVSEEEKKPEETPEQPEEDTRLPTKRRRLRALVGRLGTLIEDKKHAQEIAMAAKIKVSGCVPEKKLEELTMDQLEKIEVLLEERIHAAEEENAKA